MRHSAFALLIACLFPALALAAPPTVAIMYFDYQGRDAELALLKKGLAAMLISDLSGGAAFSVVERERLEDVLGELKLQSSARFDPASALKAGKLLGARYLVLGGYFEVMKTLRVDARVVEVETGKVLKSLGASGKPDDFLTIEQKLAQGLAAELDRLAAESQRKSSKKPVPASGPGADVAAGDGGAVTPPQRARPPKQLKAQTAVEYGRALSALDRRDAKQASDSLRKVVAQAPDFELATIDLDRLMKP